MNSEFLKLETAEKLVKYNRLVLERKNIVRYLKNQVAISQLNMKKYSQAKEKNLLLIAQTTNKITKEILTFMDEKV